MAARNFIQEIQTPQRGVVKLFAKATGTGTDAAQTLTSGVGVASIVQSATSTLTITLSDKYAAFLGLSFSVVDAGTVDDWSFSVTAETVSTTKTIVGTVFKGGSAAALPATAKACFEINLLNTSQIPAKG